MGGSATYSYMIGGLPIVLKIEEGICFWQCVFERFAPFVSEPSDNPALCLTIGIGERPSNIGKPMLSMGYDSESALMTMDVYACVGGWRLVRIAGRESQSECWLRFRPGTEEMNIILSSGHAVCEASTAAALAYSIAGARAGIMLAHASCIELDERAYLFIGQSGAGKSTHARMWLNNYAGARFVNDDHPIVREIDGEFFAFGSPWSGKGQCYRRVQYPLAGIARIVKSDVNRMERLSAPMAYASLASSFSVVSWIGELVNDIHHSLESLVRAVPVFDLYCKPEPAAAEVAYARFANNRF